MRHEFFLPLKTCRTLMYQADPNQTETPLVRQSYSLATLLFAMTVCSLWMFWLAKLPWMAVPALAFLLPAACRTIACVNVRKRQGLDTSMAEKATYLFSSSVLCFAGLALLAVSTTVAGGVIAIMLFGALDYFPSLSTFLASRSDIYLSSYVIGFLVGLAPPLSFLYDDWPRIYDINEKRFLTRLEIQKRKQNQTKTSAEIVHAPSCQEAGTAASTKPASL